MGLGFVLLSSQSSKLSEAQMLKMGKLLTGFSQQASVQVLGHSLLAGSKLAACKQAQISLHAFANKANMLIAE